MIPITSAISGGLVWSKIPHTRGYELRSNSETVASLQCTSCWKSEFRAESQPEKWKFRRVGFWRIDTEIADANSGIPIAIFRRNWAGGGILAFTDGETFRLSRKGFWRPVWVVRASNGQPVLSLDARAKAVTLSNELSVREDRMTLLAIFAWYIMRQTAEDDAAAAVVVAATS